MTVSLAVANKVHKQGVCSDITHRSLLNSTHHPYMYLISSKSLHSIHVPTIMSLLLMWWCLCRMLPCCVMSLLACLCTLSSSDTVSCLWTLSASTCIQPSLHLGKEIFLNDLFLSFFKTHHHPCINCVGGHMCTKVASSMKWNHAKYCENTNFLANCISRF